MFEVIRRLRDRGVAFLYVSHHLQEIFELADELTVLRDGRHIATRPVGDVTMEELVRLIVGRDPRDLTFGGERATPGDTVLEVRDVARPPLLAGVSFDVRSGEILAITGAIGSGRTELARALVGVERLTGGEVRIPAVGPVRSPAHAARHGIAYLPEDRKRHGILATRDITDNVDVGWLATTRSILDRPGRRCAAARRQVAALGVKTPNLRQQARRLSGGNQQKMLLGRWLAVDARVLLLDGPTEGVDIGSKLEIYALLRRLAADGVAVVLFTSDLEEAQLVADRAIGLRRGRIAGELTGDDITEQALLELQYGTTTKEMAGA
ncbi:MAG: sugar ABC transporter ATP-binding protein [Solirubrobacteraceae bacterium]|nr:sugar ABC transporter ATP-binding protein [Solirubrobacteraceae bacterium]